MNKYTNYFADHYKVDFSQKEIDTYAEWFSAQLRYITSKVKLKQKANVLEIGSGFGGFYNMLDTYRFTYTGLEMDPKAVTFANLHFKTKSFKNTPIEKYTTKEAYKYVFAFEVLEHLENPKNVIRKIHSLLGKRGVFIGTSPYPFAKNVYADETHTYVLHPENWKKLFLDNGFSAVETYPMSFLPFLWRVHRNLNVLLPFYFPIKHIISTSLIIARK